jgi:hypothetical protein
MPWVAVSRSKSVFEVPQSDLQGLPEFHLEPRMPWVAVSRSKSVFEVPQSDLQGLPEFHLEPRMPWVAVSRSKSQNWCRWRVGDFWQRPTRKCIPGSGRRRGEPPRRSPQPAGPQQPQSPALRLRCHTRPTTTPTPPTPPHTHHTTHYPPPHTPRTIDLRSPATCP